MRVLVVDDEIKNAELTALGLRDAGHQVEFVQRGSEALTRLEKGGFDALVTDLRMPPPDGLAVLTEARKRLPELTVILMTAYADTETARRAFRNGAYDYVNKEGDFLEELRGILARAEREGRLAQQNRQLAVEVDSMKKGLATVIGASPAVKQALSLAQRVAVTDSTVLLRGESGTGKDLFARAIHLWSPRAAGAWVKVNCGALPEHLLESELFGHERGAFTGAVRQKPGRFEDSGGGTIFLDEIGELPMGLQVKLLQVIEEKTFTRVGGNKPVTVDTRIVAATNRDLDQMARERQFREDLFFRLNVFPISLPALRDRRGDIPELVGWFLRRKGTSLDQVTPEALEALTRYSYPGNVRELEHTLERALILAGGELIGPEHLSFTRPELTASGESWVPRIPPGGLSLDTLERELILQALELAGGNKSQAARLIGLTRRTLYSRMEKHGLRKPGEAEDDGEGSEHAEARAEEES